MRARVLSELRARTTPSVPINSIRSVDASFARSQNRSKYDGSIAATITPNSDPSASRTARDN
jgi:hypothetical protein